MCINRYYVYRIRIERASSEKNVLTEPSKFSFLFWGLVRCRLKRESGIVTRYSGSDVIVMNL